MNHWGSPFDWNANGSLKNPVIIPNKTFFELSDDFTYEYSAVQGSMLKYHDKFYTPWKQEQKPLKFSLLSPPFQSGSFHLFEFPDFKLLVKIFRVKHFERREKFSWKIFAGSGVLRFSHLKESCCFAFL